MLPIAAAARRFLRRQQDYNLSFSWIHFLKALNPLLSNQCLQPVGVFVAVWSEQDAVQLSLTPHHSRSHIEGSENRRPLNASLIRFFPSCSVLLVAGSIDGKLKKKKLVFFPLLQVSRGGALPASERGGDRAARGRRGVCAQEAGRRLVQGHPAADGTDGSVSQQLRGELLNWNGGGERRPRIAHTHRQGWADFGFL